MKKIISVIILLTVSILTLSGCGSTVKQQAVADTTQQVQKVVKDTPYQIGRKGQMSASVMGFDFDKSYEEADIIAEIEIIEWLGEIDEELERTVFKAKLKKTYKNTVDSKLKEICLIQTGNSNFTIKDYPLFKNGDRLILYLKKTEIKGYENAYYILGVHTGVFRIVNTDGKDYVVKQVGDCPELSEAKVTENKDNNKIRNNLSQNFSIEFPNLNEVFPQTYDLEAVESLIEKQKNK